MTVNVGGLMEALVAIHQPNKCWGGGAHPDHCTSCSEVWPCQTLKLVCDALGQPHPPRQMTGCDGMVDVGTGWTACLRDRGHDGRCRNQEGREQPTFCDQYDAFPVLGPRPEGWSTREP